MKNIREYIGYATALVAVCAWIVTLMWYGRLINEMSEDLDALNKAMIEQIQFNTRIETYIELDAR